MNTQPEALRLADTLIHLLHDWKVAREASAELRRLHELNRELVDSLGEVVAYCEEHGFSWSVLAQAKTTLNKATGESNE